MTKVPWTLGSVHDLRRTWATELADHVDLLTLCRWGGWANPAACQQFYHSVKDETAARARRAMAGLYGDGVGDGEIDAQLTRKPISGQTLAATGTENAVPDTMNGESARSSIG